MNGKRERLAIQLTVGLTHDEHRQLQTAASRAGLSMSAFIRTTIKRILEADHAPHPTTQAATQ